MTRLATALSLAASLVVPGALAQEQAAETQARSSLLEEIVVRARKKAEGEAAQDTPIAMTAFGEAQFKAVFADDLGDLGMMSPNVELKPSSQVGNQNFTIRGMGVSGTTPSDSPAVGVFQNGVFWGVNYGSLLDTFDVESVEILRGPQGTLFGRNVTGGAVVVRTKRPDGEFGLDAEAVMGNYGRQDIAVGIQGPLVEGLLSGRLAVLKRGHDGYYNNLEKGGDDFGKTDSTVARATLTLTPTENFDATLIVEGYEEDGDSVAAIGFEVPGNLPYNNGFRQPDDWWDIRLDNPGESDIEVDSFTLEMNWDLGHGVITAISGYRDLSVYNHTDFDGSGFSGFNQSIDLEQDQFSQEIRYASTFSDWVEFTLGAYHFEQEQDYREGRALNNGANVFASGNHMEQDSQALFGEVDFNLSEQWVVTVGG
ncbi:MAG: TonB-dependent receptor, partial [Porticoccaceae bacterium]|nr:TonB-dependent receptor [Porticoccaceae bacterium]